MGTIQSCEQRNDQNDESTFDLLNCVCFGNNHHVMESKNKNNSHKSKAEAPNSLDSHLLKLHVTQGPYLGTNNDIWHSTSTVRHVHNDADENDSYSKEHNLLDISHLHSEPPLTPQPIESSLHTRSYSDRHQKQAFHLISTEEEDEEDRWSAVTGRTSTSDSTDAVDQSYHHNYCKDSSPHPSQARDISISFTPRRLFVQEDSLSLGTSNANTTLRHRNDIRDRFQDKRICINTLPSFIPGKPIRLKIRLSYGDNCHRPDPSSIFPSHHPSNSTNTNEFLNMRNISLLTDAEHAHLFSYDPNFSSGQFCISTVDDQDYGNGLCVTMGAQYMTLQDQDGHIWGIIRSRNTFFPSAIIYSPKERYSGQTPSYETGGIQLYPWALVQKHGRRLDHDVSIHMVAVSTGSVEEEFIGGLFEKTPIFWSKHGFDHRHNHSHTHSVVFHVVEKKNMDGTVSSVKEVPCCMSVRDMVSRDTFDVTIAPGVDPLIILCYMTAHSKMDVEPDLRKL